LAIKRNVIPNKLQVDVVNKWKDVAILAPNRGEAAGKADAENIK